MSETMYSDDSSSSSENQKECDNDKLRTCTGLLTSYHGVAYQVQWLMLVALEARNRGAVSGFTFKTEVDYKDSGKFDDVVWHYYNTEEQKFKYNFLQAKHKLDEENEKLSMKDLLKKETTKNNPFGLAKYYISYRDNIKNNSKYKNGIIENLIIATNIDLDSDLKEIFKPCEIENPILNMNEIYEGNKCPTCWKVESNINEGKIIEIFDSLKDTYDVVKLAKTLEENIFNHQKFVLPDELQVYTSFIHNNVFNSDASRISENFIENKNLSQESKFLREAFFYEAYVKKRKLLCIEKDCHISKIDEFVEFVVGKMNKARKNVVSLTMIEKHKDNIKKLANFVLIKEDGIKFNPKFWTQDKINDSFKIFREKFKNELQRCKILDAKNTNGEIAAKLETYRFVIANFTTCRMHHIDEDSFWDVVKSYNTRVANISCKNKNINSLPSFDLSNINKDIEDFFDILVFAVNYNKNSLHEVVEDNLNQNFNWIDNEFTAYAFRSEIANALDLTQEKFISTAEEVSQFFNKVKRQTNRLILLGPTLEYCTKIDSYNTNFRPEVINEHLLHIFINNELQFLKNRRKNDINDLENLSTKQVLCIKTEQKVLSSIKVFNVLKDTPKYSNQKNYIFMRLESIMLLEDYVMQVFNKGVNLLIIECDIKPKQGSIRKLYKKIISILRRDINKKLLLITQDNDFLTLNLKNEFKSNYYETPDLEICLSSLDNTTQISLLQEGKIVFQGNELSIGDLVNESKYLIDSEILSHLLNHDKLEICKTFLNMDKIINFYVPREIICRKKVSNEFIKEKKDDLFVFSNIEETELVNIALLYNNNEENYTKKIRKFNEIDIKNPSVVKFIILNEEQEKNQYLQLCEIYQDRNIHWLVKESNYFKWRRSKGILTNLRPYLQARKYYKEICDKDDDNNNEIINELKNYRIIIIAAEPGMGKSTMLTHLALKMKKINPSIWIVVIDLARHRSQLEKISLIDKDSVMEFLYTAVGFTVLQRHKEEKNHNRIMLWFKEVQHEKETIEKLNIKGSDLLEMCIFKNKLYKRNEVYIFLDGFDEICPVFEDRVTYLINILKVDTQANLWVTSRTYNIIDKLEDNLGTFSYSIKPFCEKDQKSFFIKYWKSCLNIRELDEQRCDIFINELLTEFSKVTNDTKRTFVGIPLQIRMLAQNRLTMFQEFYESGVSQLNNEYKMKNNKGLNLVSLYEEFIDIKFHEIRFKEKKPDYPSYYDEDILKMIKMERKEFLYEHQILAVYALYSDIDELFPGTKERVMFILPKITKAEDKNAIIDRVIDTIPSFVHQTYAEYFAALFLWNKFKTLDHNPIFLNKMFNRFFLSDSRIQVCNFFYFIADKNLKEKIQCDFIQIDDKFAYILYELDPIVKSIYKFCKKNERYLRNGIDDLKDIKGFEEENSDIFAKNPNYVQVVKLLFYIIESYLYVNKSDKAFIDFINGDTYIDLLRMTSEIGCLNFVERYKLNKVYDYEKCSRSNHWYFSPLFLAAKNGHLDELRYLSDIINHNWIDKEQRTLAQCTYSYQDLNVIRNCLTLNIFDGDAFFWCPTEKAKTLPIIRAFELKWPADIIKQLIEKTDVTIFNDMFVDNTFVKASFQICFDLLQYEISITNLMLEKGMKFIGVINILLYEFSRSSLLYNIDMLKCGLSQLLLFRTEQECSNLFKLIETFLISGVGYNNLDKHGKTTIQYSKEIYYLHKLLKSLSNTINNISPLNTLLKLIIDTVMYNKKDYKIMKDSDDLLLLFGNRHDVNDKSTIRSQYNTIIELIPACHKDIFVYLGNPTNEISSKLDNLMSYIEKCKIDIEQLLKNPETKCFINILVGYVHMLLTMEDELKLELYKSLPPFEKYIFQWILYLCIRQDYDLSDACNEVLRTIWRYKGIRSWMEDKPQTCDISYEDIIYIFDLHCNGTDQSKCKNQMTELTKNILECGGLESLYNIWSELSHIGEQYLVQVMKSMSKYESISENIFKLIHSLDEYYMKLINAIKTSQNIYDLLKCIDNNFIKAIINGQDSEHGSPLHYAAYIGNIQYVEILLQYGADPDQPLECNSELIGSTCLNCTGDTALHIATKKGNLDIIQLFLEYNANCNAKTRDKLTAENLAKERLYQNPEIYQPIINILCEANRGSRYNDSGRKRIRSPSSIRQNSPEETSSKILKI